MVKYTPHIGKNVIETLTLGMYDDARFIYREYVQNAADQIDVAVEEKILTKKSDGQINIFIDKNQKTIIIEDNATGIKSNEVLKFLGDVANSQKDRNRRKGFRGIGRLGGLGYCEKLIFETTYKGESKKSTITLDAKMLKRIIDNKADVRDASAVISAITELDTSTISEEEHFFKVKLENVTQEELLDAKRVRNYLSMVAPVPFQKDFPFRKKIHNYFNKNNVKIEEYDVHLSLNNEKLYKPYKIELYDEKGKLNSTIIDVDFFNIENNENELIGLGWYGISNNLNYQIPKNNLERGVRLRRDNIGIGNQVTMERFFKETRQNLNYIGEIYAVGSEFIPNARRDYFNDNRTLEIFENKLKDFLSNLGKYIRESSTLHSRKKDILNYQKKLEKFENESRQSKYTKREESLIKEELNTLYEKAVSSKEIIDRIQQKSATDSNLKVIFKNIIEESDLNIKEWDEISENNEKKYPIQLSQLSSEKKELVEEIFIIIENNLPWKKAEMLKKKIAEHYN